MERIGLSRLERALLNKHIAERLGFIDDPLADGRD